MTLLEHRETRERVLIETRPRGAYPGKLWRVVERGVPRPSRALPGLERVRGRWIFRDREAVRAQLKRAAAKAMDPAELLARIEALEAAVAELKGPRS